MQTDYLRDIKAYYAEAIAPYLGQPVGASAREVQALEQQLGFNLPLAYRQYLLWMGHDYHGVFVGSRWFLSSVFDNTSYLPQLLAENHVDFPLPDRYLAFFSHQGYIIAWFRLPKESENPRIFLYAEGYTDGKTVVEYASFTDFLNQEIKYMAHCIQQTRR